MAEEKIYLCSICGFDPENRANWCDLGCGFDYREMIGLPARVRPFFEGRRHRELVSALKQWRQATESRLRLLDGRGEAARCMLKADRDLIEALERVSSDQGESGE